jgi:hypothetical protein
MSIKKPAIDVNAVIAKMNKFATNTKSDDLSVTVARIAQRLHRVDDRYQSPLTDQEMRIINLFQNNKEAA